MSLLATLGWPWKREKKRALMVGVGGRWNFGKDWNFGKKEKLVACGGRKEIKKKEKGKEIIKEDIFFGLENENIEKTISRV